MNNPARGQARPVWLPKSWRHRAIETGIWACDFCQGSQKNRQLRSDARVPGRATHVAERNRGGRSRRMGGTHRLVMWCNPCAVEARTAITGRAQ